MKHSHPHTHSLTPSLTLTHTTPAHKHPHLGVLPLELLPGHEDVEEAKVEQLHLSLSTTLHHVTDILRVERAEEEEEEE